MANKIIITNSASDGTPSSGSTELRVDSTTKALTSVDDTGTEIVYGAGAGDVVGPASSVDSRVAMFDGATGKLLKDSGLTLSGSNTGDQTSIGAIDSATTTINVDSATAPTVGQVLTATSSTAATWQAAAAGGNSFETIQPDAGTAPVADSATDTLTMTSADSSVTITGDSAADSLDFATRYSNPNASHASSEIFGASAAVTAANSTAIGASSSAGLGGTAIGQTAVSSGSNSTALGRGADATQSNALALGNNTFAVGSGAVAVGTNAYTGGTGGVAIGTGAANIAKIYSISLGQNSSAQSDYSFNVGGVGGHIKDIFLGESEVTTSGGAQLNDITIRPTRPSTRTDVVGGSLILMGAGSTGNLVGSSVKLQTQTASGASGTTDNVTWTDMLEANGSGEVVLNAKDAATADGTLWANSLSFYLDETGNTVTVKAKYADGTTIKTGTIALT